MSDNCLLPEDFWYLVEHHVWARPEPFHVRHPTPANRVVKVGVTDVFQALAEQIMFFTPRRVHRQVGRGRPVAVLESGKWLGIVPSPVNGEIVEYNAAVAEDPGVLNRDPYQEGWIARVRVLRWDLEQQGLVTGTDGVTFYRQSLERDGIRCR
jgi:glycine cleavage system H protein